MFDALDFLAELTQHIPPKRLQLIRRYGLYASRTKGRWVEMPWVAQRAPEGWKTAHQCGRVADDPSYEPLSGADEKVNIDTSKRAWARVLAKVYEVDPMVCPRMHGRASANDQRKCSADMKCRARSSDFVLRYDPYVIAVIEDPDELKRILRHLVKTGRSPPGFDPDRLNR